LAFPLNKLPFVFCTLLIYLTPFGGAKNGSLMQNPTCPPSLDLLTLS